MQGMHREARCGSRETAPAPARARTARRKDRGGSRDYRRERRRRGARGPDGALFARGMSSTEGFLPFNNDFGPAPSAPCAAASSAASRAEIVARSCCGGSAAWPGGTPAWGGADARTRALVARSVCCCGCPVAADGLEFLRFGGMRDALTGRKARRRQNARREAHTTRKEIALKFLAKALVTERRSNELRVLLLCFRFMRGSSHS